jgi:hypothetical protein
MEPEMRITETGDVERVYDEANRDVLVGRRLEVFFDPNEDGSASTRGRLIWHTEWWHYTGSVLRGTSLGQRIERTIEQVLAGDFGGIPGPVVIGAVKAAYIAHAGEDFGLLPMPPASEPEVESVGGA